MNVGTVINTYRRLAAHSCLETPSVGQSITDRTQSSGRFRFTSKVSAKWNALRMPFRTSSIHTFPANTRIDSLARPSRNRLRERRGSTRGPDASGRAAARGKGARRCECLERLRRDVSTQRIYTVSYLQPTNTHDNDDDLR